MSIRPTASARRSPRRRRHASLLVAAAALGLIAAGCGDDDTTATTPPTTIGPTTTAASATTAAPALTAEERAWCAFENATEEEALKFDVIFEAGLRLELNMDVVNATASALRAEYLAQGMSDDEAVRAVSVDLFDLPDFVAACKAAYADEVGRSG